MVILSYIYYNVDCAELIRWGIRTICHALPLFPSPSPTARMITHLSALPTEVYIYHTHIRICFILFSVFNYGPRDKLHGPDTLCAIKIHETSRPALHFTDISRKKNYTKTPPPDLLTDLPENTK